MGDISVNRGSLAAFLFLYEINLLHSLQVDVGYVYDEPGGSLLPSCRTVALSVSLLAWKMPSLYFHPASSCHNEEVAAPERPR